MRTLVVVFLLTACPISPGVQRWGWSLTPLTPSRFDRHVATIPFHGPNRYKSPLVWTGGRYAFPFTLSQYCRT